MMGRRRNLRLDNNKAERENTPRKKRKDINDVDADLGDEKVASKPKGPKSAWKKTKDVKGKKSVYVGDEKITSTDEETKSANEGNENVTSQFVNRRGKTVMHKLYQLRLKGERKKIEFNKLGQPYGPNNTEMRSYIGVLVRELVNINYKEWPQVPTDVKEQIWESVNLSFIVVSEYKKGCLASTNDKWRGFKTTLTTKFVFKRMDSPALNIPPKDYGITKADWSAFVISRLTKEFQESSSSHKSLRKNIKYQHRLSRKGYANYAVENDSILSGDADIDRATLWVHGRRSKNGEFEGEELVERVTKINEFIEQKKTGIEESSSQDILSSALDSRDHGGRVRGMGALVTPSTFFTIPKKSGNSNSLLEDTRAHLGILEAVVKDIRDGSKTTEEKGSCSIRDNHPMENDDDFANGDHKSISPENNFVFHIDDDEDLKGKAVELSLSSRVDVAVAVGTFIRVNGPKEEIHGIPCPNNSVRVSIDYAIDENAQLPIRIREFENIGDAVGSHVAWPKHLVKLRRSETKKKNVEVQKSALKKDSMPMSLWFVYCFSKRTKETIEIPLDVDVFGLKCQLFVHLEDVDPFARLEPISATCIAVYIWHLYNRLITLNKKEKFIFVNPWKSSASHSRDKTIADNYNENRSKDLAKTFAGTTSNQLVLVPCNLTSAHWVLTIINPHKEEVCFIDPLYRIIDHEWKRVVDMVLIIFNAGVKSKRPKKNNTWNIIKAPKQPDGEQCGYFVLRYMNDIIEFDGVVETDSMQSVFSQNYSKKEIEDVREEWADCLSEYMD